MIAGLKRALPLLVLVAGFLLFQNRWRIELLLNPIDNTALQAQDVLMYSTSWCPYCAKTRNFLQQADIPFTELDIEKSDSALKQYQQLGGRGVPVLKIGRIVIQGYDPELMRKALERLPNQEKPLAPNATPHN